MGNVVSFEFLLIPGTKSQVISASAASVAADLFKICLFVRPQSFWKWNAKLLECSFKGYDVSILFSICNTGSRICKYVFIQSKSKHRHLCEQNTVLFINMQHYVIILPWNYQSMIFFFCRSQLFVALVHHSHTECSTFQLTSIILFSGNTE